MDRAAVVSGVRARRPMSASTIAKVLIPMASRVIHSQGTVRGAAMRPT